MRHFQRLLLCISHFSVIHYPKYYNGATDFMQDMTTVFMNDIAQGHGYAIPAVLCAFCIFFAMGNALLRLLRLPAMIFPAIIAGMNLAAIILLGCMTLFPGSNTPSVAGGVLFLCGIAALFAGKYPSLKTVKENLRLLLMPAILFAVFFPLFTAIPSGWDECVYQVAVPYRWMQDGALTVYRDLPYSGFPALPQILYVPLLYSGGTLAVKLFYGGCMFLFLTGIALLARKMPRSGQILLLLTLISAHTVQFVFRDIYAEPFFALNVTAGLLLLQRDRSKRAAILCGLLAGGITAVKLSGALIAFCFLLTAFFMVRKEERLRFALIFCITAAVFSLPFYLRPWVITGNPFYPYLGGSAMSRFHHALGAEKFGFENPVIGFLSSFGALTLPGRYKYFDGSFGLAFLFWGLLIIGYLLLLFRRKRYRQTVYFLPFAVFYAGWFLSSPQARFLIGGLPFILFAVFRAYRLLPYRGRRIFCVIIAAGMIVSVWEAHIGRRVYLDGKQLFTGNSKTMLDLFYGRTGDDYLPACTLLREITPEEKILLLFEERTLAMPRNAEIGTPLFQEKYFTNGDYSPAAVEQEIRKHKIKAVYLRLPQNNPDLLEETLARYPLFRDSLSALTAQGKCRCKTVTRHSQIFYFR